MVYSLYIYVTENLHFNEIGKYCKVKLCVMSNTKCDDFIYMYINEKISGKISTMRNVIIKLTMFLSSTPVQLHLGIIGSHIGTFSFVLVNPREWSERSSLFHKGAMHVRLLEVIRASS